MAKREDTEIHGYVGPNQSGKTWLAMAQPCTMPCQLRIRVNEKDPTLAQGAEIITDASVLRQRFADWTEKGKPRGLIICWDGSRKYGIDKGWEIAARLALQTQEIEILADEAHKYCPRNIKSQIWLEDILTRGSHFVTSLRWTSTAPREMSPEFRRQSNDIAVFYANDTTVESYAQSMKAGALWDTLQAKGKYHYLLLFRAKPPKMMKPYKK